MSKNLFKKIHSFLLGASVSFIIIGASLVFIFFKSYSIVLAFLVTFVFFYLSLFLLLMLDNFKTQKEILEELKKS